MEKYLIKPVIGQNSDDHPSELKDGEYSALSNYRINSISQRGGEMSPIKGDTEIENVDLPAGDNKCLLAIQDPESLEFYYFIYNSNLNHQIWRVDTITQSFQLLVEGEYLNFSPLSNICLDADIRDGLLYWCHGNFVSYEESAGGVQQFSPPRKINLEKAINFQNGTPNGYPNMDWQTLEAIKYPYSNVIVCTYQTDDTKKSNFLRRKLFQFRIQYIYDDNEVSRWSWISKLPNPNYAETMGGDYPFSPEKDNRIFIRYNTGHHTVRRIKIAYREGNYGSWYVFKEINKDIDGIGDNVVASVYFYNNEQKTPIAISDQNYDLLPQVCQTQEMLSNDEIVYGRILQDYDLENIDGITTDYTIANIGDGANGITHHELTAEIDDGAGLPQTEFEVDIIPNYDEVLYYIPIGTVFILTFELANQDPETYIYETTVDYIGTGTVALINFLTAWRNFLILQGSTAVFTINIGDQNLVVTSPGILNFVSASILVSMPNRRFRSWKTGTERVFGIQYYDAAMRDGTVYTNDDCQLYIKSRAEEDKSGLTDNQGDYIVTINMRIDADQQPPMWARHYQFVVAKHIGITSSQDRTVKKIEISTQYSGRVKMSLERYYRDTYDGATYHHDIQVGDRVRLVRASHPVNNGFPLYVKDTLELTVLRYEEAGGEDETEAIYTNFFDWEDVVLANEGFMIEISRGFADEEGAVWEEVGEMFSVVSPHTDARAHFGQVPGVTGAIISVSEGDIYKRLRNMGTGFTSDPHQSKNWYVEDFHYSDYYLSNFTNRGRLAIKDVNNKSRWINVLRSSNKFIQDTNINGLNRFDATDKMNITGDYGAITRIVEIGFTLKVICASKEYSVYINRQEAANDEGNYILVDETFGQLRPMLNDWGTVFPRSVCVAERSLYYWDVRAVALVESNANGQINLASKQFKYSTFYKLYSDQAIQSGLLSEDEFVIGFEEKYNSILMSMEPSSAVIKNTVSINRDTKRTEFSMTYFAETFLSIRNEMWSWDDGVLYKHEAGPNLVFRGIQQSFGFSTYTSCGNPREIKVAMNINSLSDVHPGVMQVNGNRGGSYNLMGGIVWPHLWRQIENEWVNYITGDITEVEGVDWVFARYMVGRPIRGNFFLISVQKDEDFARIASFELYYLNSPI